MRAPHPLRFLATLAIATASCYLAFLTAWLLLLEVPDILLAVFTPVEFEGVLTGWIAPRVLLRFPSDISSTLYTLSRSGFVLAGPATLALGLYAARRSAGWLRVYLTQVLLWSSYLLALYASLFAVWTVGPFSSFVRSFWPQPGCLARASHSCWSSRGWGRCCGVPFCLSAPAGRQCRRSPRSPAGAGTLATAARCSPNIHSHTANLSLLAGILDPAWQSPAWARVFRPIEWSSRCVGAAARSCPITNRAGWRRYGAVHLCCCSRRVAKLRPACSPGPSRQLPIAPI